MCRSFRFPWLLVAMLLALVAAVPAQAEIKPIARLLPPTDEIQLSEAKLAELQTQLATLEKQRDQLSRTTTPHRADADVYLKAVKYALEFKEFYNAKDPDKATAALKSASQRLEDLAAGKAPWTRQTGLVTRGYYSKIDDSPQPYGLVIPEKHDFEMPCPLYVWLHGRGDKQTDLHFLIEREKSKGQITPPGAIVVHPFGRHCVGFKHAGEIDVLEVVEQVQQQYKIDDQRIVLIGFSMGGAGAWHLGAHYADKWAVVAPGAGFAETAQYTKTDPAKVPEYERTLWGVYDVPDYVRNLFNTRVIAYSGENDKQIQAARVMEAAYKQEGRELEHLIGPGVEHKYEPKTLETLLGKIKEELDKPKLDGAKFANVEIQTRTLRYSAHDRVRIERLTEHGKEARLSLSQRAEAVHIITQNVAEFSLHDLPSQTAVTVDGRDLVSQTQGKRAAPDLFTKVHGVWFANRVKAAKGLEKLRGLQGPIDDAFLEPFLVVLPSGKSPHALEQEWIEFESAHLQSRWKALMRGEVRVKKDVDVSADDLKRFHVVLWGMPESNRVLAAIQKNLPVSFTSDELRLGDQTYPRGKHLPALIYPNPLNPTKYVVLNSGLTFREAHDKTNSQQNPKLPDWAIIDITQPPDAISPGRIAAAGFFDEEWKLK